MTTLLIGCMKGHFRFHDGISDSEWQPKYMCHNKKNSEKYTKKFHLMSNDITLLICPNTASNSEDLKDFPFNILTESALSTERWQAHRPVESSLHVLIEISVSEDDEISPKSHHPKDE